MKPNINLIKPEKGLVSKELILGLTVNDKNQIDI